MTKHEILNRVNFSVSQFLGLWSSCILTWIQCHFVIFFSPISASLLSFYVALVENKWMCKFDLNQINGLSFFIFYFLRMGFSALYSGRGNITLGKKEICIYINGKKKHFINGGKVHIFMGKGLCCKSCTPPWPIIRGATLQDSKYHKRLSCLQAKATNTSSSISQHLLSSF